MTKEMVLAAEREAAVKRELADNLYEQARRAAASARRAEREARRVRNQLAWRVDDVSNANISAP